MANQPCLAYKFCGLRYAARRRFCIYPKACWVCSTAFVLYVRRWTPNYVYLEATSWRHILIILIITSHNSWLQKLFTRSLRLVVAIGPFTWFSAHLLHWSTKGTFLGRTTGRHIWIVWLLIQGYFFHPHRGIEVARFSIKGLNPSIQIPPFSFVSIFIFDPVCISPT